MRRLYDQLFKSDLVDDIHKLSSIADSILCLPSRFSDAEWQVLSAPHTILKHYGENLFSNGDAPVLIPYMKHIAVSGGMCSQACCFMATLLSYDRTREVVSIPEISMLGVGIESFADQSVLWLRGLSHQEVQRYFRSPKIGLQAAIQIGEPIKDRSASVSDGRDSTSIPPLSSTEKLKKSVNHFDELFATEHDWKDILTAIQSYIDSQCPILCPVDIDRMAGRQVEGCTVAPIDVYGQNYWELNKVKPRVFSKKLPEPNDRRHLIVVIGYQKNSTQLLFNDPGHLPFMKMSMAALLQNACYQKNKRRAVNQTALEGEFKFGKHVEPGTIIPVTPNNVVLPLLDSIEYLDHGEEELHAGLYTLTKFVTSKVLFNAVTTAELPAPSYRKSRFLLKQLIDLENFSLEKTTISQNDFRQRIKDLKNLKDSNKNPIWRSDQWVWLQIHQNSVLLWNAEKSPPQLNNDSEDFLPWLIFALSAYGQRRNHLEGLSTPVPNSEPPPVAPARNSPVKIKSISKQKKRNLLNAGLITSFSSEGISGVEKLTPVSFASSISAFDLYCFMSSESAEILGDVGHSKRQYVEKFLRNTKTFVKGCYRGIPLQIDHNYNPFYKFEGHPWEPFIFPKNNICHWLASCVEDPSFASRMAHRIRARLKKFNKCVAITTFFPGITSCSETDRLDAINALRCIIRVGKEFNRLVGDNQICVVEMVGGGLISKRWAASKYIGDRKIDCIGAKVLSKDVARERILAALELIVPETEGEIALALELEPGLLFSISNWEDLKNLSIALAGASPEVSKAVGFNCDIAHWALAGISYADIQEEMKNESASVGVVSSRIVHAHMSDFGKGHFGDLGPTQVNSEVFFVQWLNSVNDAYEAASQQGRNASGFVSLEMELPESPRALFGAWNKIVTLCQKSATASNVDSRV